jgi:hypothetical protein
MQILKVKKNCNNVILKKGAFFVVFRECGCNEEKWRKNTVGRKYTRRSGHAEAEKIKVFWDLDFSWTPPFMYLYTLIVCSLNSLFWRTSYSVTATYGGEYFYIYRSDSSFLRRLSESFRVSRIIPAASMPIYIRLTICGRNFLLNFSTPCI